jgi:hypothetical protein
MKFVKSAYVSSDMNLYISKLLGQKVMLNIADISARRIAVLYEQKQDRKIDRVSPNRRERTEREHKQTSEELIRKAMQSDSASEAAEEADHA